MWYENESAKGHCAKKKKKQNKQTKATRVWRLFRLVISHDFNRI